MWKFIGLLFLMAVLGVGTPEKKCKPPSPPLSIMEFLEYERGLPFAEIEASGYKARATHEEREAFVKEKMRQRWHEACPIEDIPDYYK